jgi:hypothetical protein
LLRGNGMPSPSELQLLTIRRFGDSGKIESRLVPIESRQAAILGERPR